MFGRMKSGKVDRQYSKNSICNDRRGVSDVVGTIMMVAITMIMSAIIASAIFSLSPPPDVPHTDIEVRLNGSTIDIYHMGGVNETEEWNIGTLIILDTNNTGLKIVHLPSQELLI
jgi:flagellin-like protein